MKNKKIVFLVLFGIFLSNLFALEDRSENFECINIYKPNNKVYAKDILTAEETIETLKDVIYLLETSYVDFDEVEKKGFDKEAFIKNGEVLFGKENQVKTEKVYDYICKSLKPYINDSHFNVGYKDKNTQLVCMKVIYLSDTYVEEFENGYKIIKSGRIPLDTELNLSEENLFKTILNGREVYRLGILAQDGKYGNFTNLPLIINNEKVNLRCIYTPEYFSSNEFKFIETKKNAYINIPMMDIGADYYKKFNECVKKCKTKKNIIIDLRQNRGGDDSYFIDFLYYLYYGEKDKNENSLQDFYKLFSDSNIKYIISSLLKQQYKIGIDYYKNNGLDTEEYESLMKEPIGISYIEKQQDNKRKEGKFTGNIIFLTSKITASSAEDIIVDSKKLFDNVFIVGTNTMGCLRNADNYIYGLKNSGIQIQAGSVQWINEFEIEEGVGFIPDYVVNGNLEETIRYLTKDKKIAKRITQAGDSVDCSKDIGVNAQDGKGGKGGKGGKDGEDGKDGKVTIIIGGSKR